MLEELVEKSKSQIIESYKLNVYTRKKLYDKIVLISLFILVASSILIHKSLMLSIISLIISSSYIIYKKYDKYYIMEVEGIPFKIYKKKTISLFGEIKSIKYQVISYDNDKDTIIEIDLTEEELDIVDAIHNKVYNKVYKQIMQSDKHNVKHVKKGLIKIMKLSDSNINKRRMGSIYSIYYTLALDISNKIDNGLEFTTLSNYILPYSRNKEDYLDKKLDNDVEYNIIFDVKRIDTNKFKVEDKTVIFKYTDTFFQNGKFNII